MDVKPNTRLTPRSRAVIAQRALTERQRPLEAVSAWQVGASL
jgi:hypothetical protein